MIRKESVAKINRKNDNEVNMKRRFFLPLILSAIYVLLCILAFVYQISKPATDKFSGIFITTLTMPGSVIEALFHDLIIAQIFNYTFNDSVWHISMVIWVIVNTILIFLITQKMLKKD